jgi:LytS/YehU family sensor histidine kinase
MGWTFVAYTCAFSGWIWIYDLVHERRRRDELEHVAREAQLRALRAQLNPHFMFNCLNSLRNAIVEHPSRAVAMVTGLADILRYSLASDQRDTVTLAEELNIVDEYLDLERARFEDRLRVERSVEPLALAVQVPPMLVQTLVENAVKHGVSPSKTGGEVRLEARVRGSRAEVVVTSSGAFRPPSDGSGHGLHNATERLGLLYGALASLSVAERNGMTVASLSVPVERPA